MLKHLLDFAFFLLAVYQVQGDIVPHGDEFWDKCISGKHHKRLVGPEGNLMKEHCKMHQSKSCCTWNTTEQIHEDGALSLYNLVWDQCPQNRKMSEKCKAHFQRDTCFYECSTNVGPWIQPVKNSKTRIERMLNVPLCASECINWYHDCLFDYTCNDNWGLNWNWKKKGTPEMCTKPCKTFKEYFADPQIFCEKIFNYSFKYETDEDNCMTFDNVAKNKEVSDKAAFKRAAKEYYARYSDATSIARNLVVCLSAPFVLLYWLL